MSRQACWSARVGLLVPLLAVAGTSTGAQQPVSPACERLKEQALPGAKVISAHVVGRGSFIPPFQPAPPGASPDPIFKRLPAFCRAEITATPSSDSEIRIELWLPLEPWNGRLQTIGNGGFAGEIQYHGLAESVLQNYAALGTDTGHVGSPVDASWALNHPEKIKDFAYRAIHVTIEVGKAATKAFFGKAPQHSYFAACSNGGRQALVEAERYPDDYDGIIAGAPANDWTHLLTTAVWDAQVTTKDPESYIPLAKIPAIAQAVNLACDAKDGVKDGILNDPRQCQFDPAILLCQEGDSDKCLTAAQAATLKKMYKGPQDSNGKQFFPAYLPGGEDGQEGWGLWITGAKPGGALFFAFGNGFFGNMVYNKPDWDPRTANLDEALKAADQLAPAFNATDPDLGRFAARGGKLIVYHGWNDGAITALSSISYFDSVGAKMGESKRDSFARLYLAPGMQHCASGPGPSFFGQFGPSELRDSRHSAQVALEQWVEKGLAPTAIIAGKYADVDATKPPQMTRPLCPYPQKAQYKGSGDTNDAANFTCGVEK
jgi:hypothetical protein